MNITRVYHIERSVFELSRTTWDMTEFDWVRSSNEVELFTEKHEWKNPALKHPRRFEVLFFSYKGNCM